MNHETAPLWMMLLGISLPVGLLVWAATSESAPVLVCAVLAMFAVGALTVMFIGRLIGDEETAHESVVEADGTTSARDLSTQPGDDRSSGL